MGRVGWKLKTQELARSRKYRRLSAAQRRFLRACESLARVRKLARTTPALQLNIAARGGQQVNVVTDQSESDS